MGKDANDSGFENEAAQHLLERAAMMKQYFKDTKLKGFEDRAGGLAAKFESARAGAGKARGYGAAAAATSQLENELDAFEAAFEKWYDEEAEDESFFAHVASLFLDIRLRLETYRAATGALGEAGGDIGKAKGICDEWKEEFKSAVQKYGAMAQQAAGKAGTAQERERAERVADTASTLLRYLDIHHEMLMAELLGKPGNDAPLAKALRMCGSPQGGVSDLRAHAYHMKSDAMQEQAAAASFAFFAYVGAVGAAFAVQKGDA
ncbi:MAG: hypothetical protein WC263_00335 [Candidatus Micrarchaeia archaeon]|jgi:hypothetical protein